MGDIGDEEDVAAASRAGLGSRPAARSAHAPGAAEPFAGVAAEAADAEAAAAAREEAAKAEKGKGNRAFQEGRVRAQHSRCSCMRHLSQL
jgi:hypothetical protein